VIVLMQLGVNDVDMSEFGICRTTLID